MQIMHSYSDVLSEIEVIKIQLKLTNSEIEYWYFGHNKSANSSLTQIDRLIDTRNKLYDRLQSLERAKEKIETLMQRFEGTEYKIAYKRIIECKTHKEIASELNLSEQYIRRLWMGMKSNKEATDRLKNV